MTLDLPLVTVSANVNLRFKFKFVQSLISQILANKGDDDIADINGGDVDQADEEDEGDDHGWGGNVRIWQDSDFPNSDKAPNPQISLIASWACCHNLQCA